ncbi:hypothetical protein [Oscillatoria salina]|uniref:hypothetical protein n=1 Tax=Oscillatoria salina TaxID=331517 RepID=UPI001CCA9D01|nr:hypothetical protein [Oscillatoria salina]
MLEIFSIQTTHLLAVSCPVLIWIVLVIFFFSVCLAIRDGMMRLRRLHQIPCSKCAFFTGDYRLKCTVHPSKALSEEAIDCLDYEAMGSPQTQQLQPRCLNGKCCSQKFLAFRR